MSRDTIEVKVTEDLLPAIEAAIGKGIGMGDSVKAFTGEVFLKFDQWPFIKLGEDLTIAVIPPKQPGSVADGKQAQAPSASMPSLSVPPQAMFPPARPPQPTTHWPALPDTRGQTTQAAFRPVRVEARPDVPQRLSAWPR